MAAHRKEPRPELRSLHVPLRITTEDALKLLRELELPIHELRDPEHHYRVDGRGYSLAIYPVDGFVRSVWYDDPLGRGSDILIKAKTEQYLSRYGSISNWRKGMTNGWMDYWFNETDRVGMVYGIHMDVIRFNANDA
jgi:hypothetical protein